MRGRAKTTLNLLYAILPGLLLCAAAMAQEKPARTDLSGIPWVPSAAPKVIYGTDDRIDVYQETDPDRQRWAASTCALISGAAIAQNPNGTYTVATSAYRPGGLAPCPDEPFGTQPAAAFCTGWLAGEDIIVTAGHCYDNGDLGSTRFVFGFDMLDANTPVLTFGADQVYVGVAVLGRALSGDLDYAVVRVDRQVTAPDAVPFAIRREGTIAAGTAIGVIGHPAGLPKKIAFGAQTAVRSSGPAGYFVANLDTYGGNSGSPVIHAQTGICEGILVRGETDYDTSRGCGASNVVSNTGGRGEDVSKTTSFMQFVPEVQTSAGEIAFDRARYACEDAATVRISDADLRGAGSAAAELEAGTGDAETLTLTETGASTGIFQAAIALRDNPAAPGNGILEVGPGGSIVARYTDAEDANGGPALVTAAADIDCAAPVISNVRAIEVGSSQATIAFDTGEPAGGRVRFGLDCTALGNLASGAATQDHRILLSGLQRQTTYHFVVSATDEAGNAAEDDNDGACYQFTTSEPFDYLTQRVEGGWSAFQNQAFEFTPGTAPAGYEVCFIPLAGLPTDPATGSLVALADDAYVAVPLTGGRTVRLFGSSYGTIYIGSNGYITFGAGDSSYQGGFELHFALPRISPLLADLAPNRRGEVRFQQFSNRAVVTYLGVPNYDPALVYPPENANTVQAELYFDGRIRIVYGSVYSPAAIIGLSRGNGLPGDFDPSIFPDYAPCFDDADSDGDGLRDLDEVVTYGTDPNDADTDGDGMPDGYEVRHGLEPTTPDANTDLDGDGVPNGDELARGIRPDRADSDRDGMDDGGELSAGTDPTGAADAHSADANGDARISLEEILRVVQLFNAGAYHCDTGSEDGYGPGPVPQGCPRHHSDYDAAAWAIGLEELLRTIELFAAGAYTRDLYTADTFAPAP